MKSCYRPASPAQRMTAWIGEICLLLTPLWELQASCLPPTHEVLSSPKGEQGLVGAGPGRASLFLLSL